MIKRIISDAKILFSNAEDIFHHKAGGEPCCHCGRAMRTEQGITVVGNGDKMHSKCWSGYFESRIDRIIKK